MAHVLSVASQCNGYFDMAAVSLPVPIQGARTIWPEPDVPLLGLLQFFGLFFSNAFAIVKEEIAYVCV